MRLGAVGCALAALALLGATSSLVRATSVHVGFPQATFVLARGSSAPLVISLHNDDVVAAAVNGVSGTWSADVGGDALAGSALASLPESIGPGETWIGAIGTLSIAPDAELGHRVYAVHLIGGEFEADAELIGVAYFAVDVQDPACVASISQSPDPVTVPAGDPAVFTVGGSAPGPITYQWRRNGESLTDGGRISGAQTAQLTVDDATGDDEGTYDVALSTACGKVYTTPVALTVDGNVDVPPVVAHVLSLGRPRPNPFSSTTSLRWTLSRPGRVRLAIHDLAGRVIVTLAEGAFPAGPHERTWDGRGADGRLSKPGFYIERLEAEGRTISHRLFLVH